MKQFSKSPGLPAPVYPDSPSLRLIGEHNYYSQDTLQSGTLSVAWCLFNIRFPHSSWQPPACCPFCFIPRTLRKWSQSVCNQGWLSNQNSPSESQAGPFIDSLFFSLYSMTWFLEAILPTEGHHSGLLFSMWKLTVNIHVNIFILRYTFISPG